MDYSTVKAIHVTAVTLSLGLFVLRGAWMLAASTMLRRPWVRVVPHVIDTVLLASAVWLALQIQQGPVRSPWLTAKVLGLVLYVVAGSVALKRGRTVQARAAAFVVALAIFAYIVAVAVTKHPVPWR
jgi:uncharacterized membrane protein SirB2